MKNLIQQHQLEVLLGISLFLSFFSWGKRVLFPFQIFTTWVHECWHAIAAVFMGGSDIRITLAPDGSGLTQFRIEKGRLRHSMVASAGYLGASVTGCLIFYLSAQTVNASLIFSAQTLILSLCAAIVFTLLFWIRNGFGWFAVAVMGAALGSLVYFSAAHPYARTVLIFIGIQTALNALFDLRVLFSLKSSKGVESDAHTMQRLFYLPAWVWAFLWLSTSVYLMHATLKHMRLL